MTIAQLINHLNKLAPIQLAETWDNVGLLIGNPECNIKAILISLDITAATIDEALQHHCNVIISHHPLIFNGIKKLDETHYTHSLIKKIIKHDLQIISFHTNLDASHHGLNDLLAKQLKLNLCKPLIPNSIDKQVGLGRIGKVSTSVSLKNFAITCKSALKLTNIRVVGNMQQKIKTVAVMSGSGGNFFYDAKRAGADVLVTGDVKYHHALDAQNLGIALIDAGHYGTEIGMIALMNKMINKMPLKLNTYQSKQHQDPFTTLGFD